MRIKIKVTNDDPHGLKQNKFFKISCLILGVILFLLGSTGFIIDLFFPSFSASYHGIAGESNGMRSLLGILFLSIFYVLRK